MQVAELAGALKAAREGAEAQQAANAKELRQKEDEIRALQTRIAQIGSQLEDARQGQ